MDLGLNGKVALVTGAGSQRGFGKEIALTLAKEGCNVVVADIDMNGAKQTASEIESLGHQSIAVKADITKSSEVNEMVQSAIAKFGRIDILVNNAGGIFTLKLFTEKTEAECDADINLNFKGMMNCTRAVLNQMIANKGGKIINIASVGASKGICHTAVYNSAKAGVVGFTKSIAAEVAPLGVIVNTISPGLGLTNFGCGPLSDEMVGQVVSRTPGRRTTAPHDIASVVAFLASDLSNNIVGQNIAVDGGESIV
jgi:3-oxoacyl-[acyl-carrier protein] reductase